MKKVLAIFLLILGLQGCLNYEQDISLNPDGSGTMILTYWMKVSDPQNTVLLDQTGLFNVDTIRNQFSTPFTVVNDISVVTDTVDSVSRATVQLEFTHIDSLNQTEAFRGSNFSLKDGAAGQKVFSQFISPIVTGFGFTGDDYTVTYKYNFPGEIIQHNATSREEKYLIWNYTMAEIGKGKTISVTYRAYKLKETPYWIYALSGAVLLIVLVFLFRKKRG
ncbi:MAG: hypothetical protein HRU80_06345 [Ignavibacteriales bacterium]|nr:hypothetical protein [Ignavibacteriaceae bacterium]QOJ28513.1 MAG: hypothetical protein HRU80_06345 [Ignavibacteriales bacterium]